jgi:hypothetical protein
MISSGVSDRLTNCARLTRDLRVVANWSVTDGRSVPVCPSVHLDVVALTQLALGVVFMHMVFISILQPRSKAVNWTSIQAS